MAVKQSVEKRIVNQEKIKEYNMAAVVPRPPTALIAYLRENLDDPSSGIYTNFQPQDARNQPGFQRDLQLLITELSSLSKVDQIFRIVQLSNLPHRGSDGRLSSPYAELIIPYFKSFINVIQSCVAGSQLSLSEIYDVIGLRYGLGVNNSLSEFIVIDSTNQLNKCGYPFQTCIECKPDVTFTSELKKEEILLPNAREFVRLYLKGQGQTLINMPTFVKSSQPPKGTKFFRLTPSEPVVKFIASDIALRHPLWLGFDASLPKCDQTEPTPVFELVPLSVKELNDMLPLLDGRPRALPVEAGVASLAATPADLSAPIADAVPFTPAEARVAGGKSKKKYKHKKRKSIKK